MRAAASNGRRLRAVVAATLAAAALSCTPEGPKFLASDVTGTQYARDFALVDHNGAPRTLADFRGKAVVLFFGYTYCPDVCPATLAAVKEALGRLGPDAARVQVLFATIDPERDTPDLLKRYVTAFDPSFIGLTGDAAAIERTAKEYKILYRKQPGTAAGAYTMDHSAGTFVYDPQGHLRVYVGYGQSADVFAHDIRELLRQPG